ncbi:hypothetical protein CK228_09295 [Mesorhizobium sp. WSM4312]|nr:hypothetical protein CK228_09295 [Mesorhizobium sp. WSM4312]
MMPAMYFAMIREASASFDWCPIPAQQRRFRERFQQRLIESRFFKERATVEKPAGRSQRASPFLRSHVSLI